MTDREQIRRDAELQEARSQRDFAAAAQYDTQVRLAKCEAALEQAERERDEAEESEARLTQMVTDLRRERDEARQTAAAKARHHLAAEARLRGAQVRLQTIRGALERGNIRQARIWAGLEPETTMHGLSDGAFLRDAQDGKLYRLHAVETTKDAP